jgi:diacylglycerol kinase (ATP)
MHVRLIRNPISGSGGMGAVVDALESAIHQAGGMLDVLHTETPTDATRLAALTPPDTHAVISAGGDGTLREVVTGMIGKTVPIVVLPSGTENVLAKHFGFTRDVRRVLDTLQHGVVEPYDVGVCGNKKFILLVGAGFDGDVVQRLHAIRSGNITHLTWTRPLIEGFLKHRFPEVCVEVDERAVFCGRGMVWVGNIPRYSLGMRVLERAKTDDGLLDVRIIPCQSRWRLLRTGLGILLRRPIRGEGVQYHQCRTARVRAPDGQPVPVQIDGDHGGTLPIECSILPAAVNFLRPKPKTEPQL